MISKNARFAFIICFAQPAPPFDTSAPHVPHHHQNAQAVLKESQRTLTRVAAPPAPLTYPENASQASAPRPNRKRTAAMAALDAPEDLQPPPVRTQCVSSCFCPNRPTALHSLDSYEPMHRLAAQAKLIKQLVDTRRRLTPAQWDDFFAPSTPAAPTPATQWLANPGFMNLFTNANMIYVPKERQSRVKKVR